MPVLKHAAGQNTLTNRDAVAAASELSVSPGPACVHLDDVSFSRFGPQQPGITAVLQGAPVVGAAVTVEDVVAMEALLAVDLVQLEVLRLIGEVERPQCRLLQDNTDFRLRRDKTEKRATGVKRSSSSSL